MNLREEENNQPELVFNEAPADPDFARAAHVAWAHLIQVVMVVWAGEDFDPEVFNLNEINKSLR